MSVLSWDRPKKLMPTAEHNFWHQSDTGIPGTYAPNMSEKDRLAWKGKLIRGNDPRVEIRKTFSRNENYAQVLIIVRLGNGGVVLSANGKVDMPWEEWDQLQAAVGEAVSRLAAEIL